MPSPKTDFRHKPEEKELWRAASAVSKKPLPQWMRDTLNKEATRTFSRRDA